MSSGIGSWIAGRMRRKPRKRLVIHAGTRKTGTTAIQHYLAHHPPQGCHYLHRQLENSSLWMATAFLPGADPNRAHLARENLKQAMAASRGPVDVLSAENIADFDVGQCQRLLQLSRPYYRQVDVHIYFRPMKSKMESAFQERLKHGYHPLEKSFRFGYRQRLAFFDEAFGRERVHAHRFAREVFPDGDVVQHFLDSAGLARGVLTAPDEQDNESLSLPAVQLLYAYRRQYPEFEPADRQLEARLQTLAGPALRFHSSLYRKLASFAPGAVAGFEARAGFSLEEDIEAHDDTGLQSEEELLALRPEALAWLARECADDSLLGAAPEQAAEALRRLR